MNIELLKERIHNKLTREYFDEVYNSFVNGNYRSAIVFLNSVLLYDLFAKLEELRDAHNDNKAEKILSEIEIMKSQSPNSSEWEKKLFDEINKNTNIFNDAELKSLNYLREIRHLCAHPVINLQTAELYNPTRETTISLIIETLKASFIKPPHLTKNVTLLLVSDLDNRTNSSFDDKEIEALIKNRYLKHLSIRHQEKLFSDMWKFVFKLKNEEANKNRTINLIALSRLLKSSEANLLKDIRDKQSHYTVDLELNLWGFQLLMIHPEVYKNLGIVVREQIKTFVQKKLDYEISAYFLENNFSDHLDRIINKFRDLKNGDGIVIWGIDACEALQHLRVYALEHGEKEHYLNLTIEAYVNSTSFRHADLMFEYLVEPNYLEYSSDQLKYLIYNSVDNIQCINRFKAHRNHGLIYNYLCRLGNDGDFEVPIAFYNY